MAEKTYRTQIKYPVERDEAGNVIVPAGMMYVPERTRTRGSITETLREHIRPINKRKKAERKPSIEERAQEIFQGALGAVEKNGAQNYLDVAKTIRVQVVDRLRREINAMLDRVERGF